MKSLESDAPLAVTTPKRRNRRSVNLTAAPQASAVAPVIPVEVSASATESIRTAAQRVDLLADGIESAIDGKARSVGSRTAQRIKAAPATYLQQLTNDLSDGGLGDDSLDAFLDGIEQLCCA